MNASIYFWLHSLQSIPVHPVCDQYRTRRDSCDLYDNGVEILQYKGEMRGTLGYSAVLVKNCSYC